ncbi:MAG: hypothetical protein WDA53_05765 [Bacillota bacterium]
MRRGIFFLLVISAITLGLTVGIPVRGIKTESIIEQRTLQAFPKLSLAAFAANEYQTDLEQALSDQLLFQQTFKAIYNKIKNKNTSLAVTGLKRLNSDYNKGQIIAEPPGEETETVAGFPVTVTPRGSQLMELDDSHHLVFHHFTLAEADDLLQNKADNINRLAEKYPQIDFSCFYIETDVDVDFINQENKHELPDSFESRLDQRIKFAKLAINNLSDFQNRFYKTDHHWNHLGQYEGYKQIIALLKGDEEPLYPTENIIFEDIRFNGYKSRLLDDYTIYDTFGIFNETVPEHKSYINNKPGGYGEKQRYLKGDYPYQQGHNHYGANGADYGLVEFRFDQPEKGNLVVFSESFSNPINRILAAHYNNAYIIDLRHYEAHCGEPFNFENFIKDKEIDDVLFLGYAKFFANDTFLIND